MDLSLHEFAKRLTLSPDIILRWVREGKIPVHIKKGNICNFNKTVIVKWAKQHNMLLSKRENNNIEDNQDKPQRLMDAMKAGDVLYNITGDSTETVLKDAVDKITTLPTAMKPELYEKLMEREHIASTGVGKGVAIPHPRSPMLKALKSPLITTCFLDKPLEFNAVDDKYVFILFILLSPTLPIHLQLLSELSFRLRNNDFITFLKSTPQQEKLFTELAEAEADQNTANIF